MTGYYWHPRDNPAPDYIVHPRELQPGDRLCIACTQTGLPSHKQAALVREWCELLPTLDGVRVLWLTTRVSQTLFDAICRMPNLEGLYIKWSGIADLAALPSLTGLRHFHLGSSTRVESIGPLAEMTGLRWLGLEYLKRVGDLEPIGGLRQLEGLTLEGRLWNEWKVRSLAPVGALTALRYLSIVGLQTEDRTLTPLFSLSSLETFQGARWWDKAEVEEL